MHWTYDHIVEEDIFQGDILQRTNELDALFAEFHPHFCDRKYTGFAVTTQTCDLVRRNGACTAPYINVAPVRPLDAVLPRILANAHGGLGSNIYYSDTRPAMERFVERLLNQNEQSVGLFYLHPDIDAGVRSPSVVSLRISVAFHSQHYDKLAAARCGRLADAFRGKLGWLVGNLFSRIATPDWHERCADAREFREVISKHLALLVPDPIWVDREAVKKAKKSGVDVAGLDRERITEVLATYARRPSRDVILERIEILLGDVIDGSTSRKLMNLIRNDSQLGAELKRRQ